MPVKRNERAKSLQEVAPSSLPPGRTWTSIRLGTDRWAPQKSDFRLDAGARTMTVMFTDIEGSTEMMERLGDREAVAVLRNHDHVVRKALRRHRGFELKHLGDGFMLVFRSALDAVTCAAAVQTALARHRLSHDEQLQVRCGLASGEPVCDQGDLFGRPVILAARLVQHARGGEILVSSAVRDLTRGLADVEFGAPKELALKGFLCPQRAYELVWRTSRVRSTWPASPLIVETHCASEALCNLRSAASRIKGSRLDLESGSSTLWGVNQSWW